MFQPRHSTREKNDDSAVEDQHEPQGILHLPTKSSGDICSSLLTCMNTTLAALPFNDL